MFDLSMSWADDLQTFRDNGRKSIPGIIFCITIVFLNEMEDDIGNILLIIGTFYTNEEHYYENIVIRLCEST